ncbi:hypothetical protein CRI85_02655 [Leuconostoc pseudomesenteroides]|uniref:hypothetical protein n=1 Tax=Leuconostoc pseudomesenteroides TaxID=33968 RepID=UPI001E55E0C1|nr:hypothetical protein [Leuconostoc pseudomesenteroides]MCC8439248.1 hypothetical protein [Leuconostoc pseudomesenteroides]
MAVIDKALNYRLIAMTFDEITWTNTVSHLIASNDGINWVDLKQYDFGWRDASVQYYGGWFYIIYTGGMSRTIDFETFQDLGWPIGVSGKRTWAPEWFVDKDGSWKIIYTQTTNGNDESSFAPYYCDYDPETNTVSNLLTCLNIDLQTEACIDLNMSFIDNVYYVWLRDDDRVIRLYASDNFDGEYHLMETNFPSVQNGYMDEGPEMVRLDNQNILLYSDPWRDNAERGLNYSISDKGDIDQWGNMQRLKGLSFDPRHFGVYDFGALTAYRHIYVINMMIQKINTIYKILSELGFVKQYDFQEGIKLDFGTQNYDQKFRNFVIDHISSVFEALNNLIQILKSNKMCDLSGNFVNESRYQSLSDDLELASFEEKVAANFNTLSQSFEELNQTLAIYGIGDNNGNN